MKYALLKLYPVGGNSGNVSLAECEAQNVTEASDKLQEHCPVPLNAHGYAKYGELSFVVGEIFGS